MDQGLAYCGGQMSNAFCIIKLLEVIVSGVILLVIIYDFIIRYSREKQINFFVLISTLLFISLICNIFYSLFHYAHPLNYLQGFVYGIYFSTIVYYVALKLIRAWRNPNNKRNGKLVAHIVFGINVVLLLCILIDKFLNPYQDCSQTWYLVVNSQGVGLSIILLIVGLRYTKKQQKKLVGINNPQNYKNPLLDIWIWIGLNIFSQTISLIETIYFQASGTCSFSQNYNVNQSVKLIFVFLSFHVGIVATIFFFRQKYTRSISQGENERKNSVNIELVEDRDSVTISE